MAGLTYAMPMIVTFVGDMERALGFYRDTLGFHVNMPNENFSVLSVPGGTTLALHAGRPNSETTKMVNTVPVFSVESIKAAKKQLEEKGVKVLDGPREVPGGLTLDIADPDGNVVQLIQRTI